MANSVFIVRVGLIAAKLAPRQFSVTADHSKFPVSASSNDGRPNTPLSNFRYFKIEARQSIIE